MACHLAVAGATAFAARAPRLAVLASASASSAGEPARRIIRRRAPPGQQGPATAPPAPAQPSVADVRRAIGVSEDAASAAAASREAKNSAFMDLVASTPIGQPESEPERRLREAAEWVVDNTETRANEGLKSFLVLCVMTFPAWFLLMFIALGVIKLPFDIPGLDNLLIPTYSASLFLLDTFAIMAAAMHGPCCRLLEASKQIYVGTFNRLTGWFTDTYVGQECKNKVHMNF